MTSYSYFLFAIVILLSFIASVVIAGADYYKTLEVDKKASAADIKKAYRKLSLKYHPDKNSAPDAAAKFAEINNAYATLSDEDQRKIYDRGGEEAVKQAEQQVTFLFLCFLYWLQLFVCVHMYIIVLFML